MNQKGKTAECSGCAPVVDPQDLYVLGEITQNSNKTVTADAYDY